MKPITQPLPPDEARREQEKQQRQQLRLTKGVLGVGHSVLHGDTERALLKAVTMGAKLASSLFYDNNVSAISLLKELKKMGAEVLIKTPETLFAYIDKRYGNKTEKQAADDIAYFHETGILRTDVPILVRNKIYAIRTASISDAPYVEWNIFEKVGGAFNGRVANFAHPEPLSSGECAATVALLDSIRPDTFSNEVKIYIAACCHNDGLLTVDPVDELAVSESYLQQFNEEGSGKKTDILEIANIKTYFEEMKAGHINTEREDLEYVQAGKLFGAYLMARMAVEGHH